MCSEQPAEDTIEFRISGRCSCRGRNCRAPTPAGGDKAENMLQRVAVPTWVDALFHASYDAPAVTYVVDQAVKVKFWNRRMH